MLPLRFQLNVSDPLVHVPQKPAELTKPVEAVKPPEPSFDSRSAQPSDFKHPAAPHAEAEEVARKDTSQLEKNESYIVCRLGNRYGLFGEYRSAFLYEVQAEEAAFLRGDLHRESAKRIIFSALREELTIRDTEIFKRELKDRMLEWLGTQKLADVPEECLWNFVVLVLALKWSVKQRSSDPIAAKPAQLTVKVGPGGFIRDRARGIILGYGADVPTVLGELAAVLASRGHAGPITFDEVNRLITNTGYDQGDLAEILHYQFGVTSLPRVPEDKLWVFLYHFYSVKWKRKHVYGTQEGTNNKPGAF